MSKQVKAAAAPAEKSAAKVAKTLTGKVQRYKLRQVALDRPAAEGGE